MKIKKCVFIILGCICLGLGTVGVFLPILPTTPFYLLTVFFFANSSQKLHDWFLGTKLYSSAGRVSSSERYGLHRADTGCGKLAFPEASGRGRENVRSGGNRRDGSQRRISKDPVQKNLTILISMYRGKSALIKREKLCLLAAFKYGHNLPLKDTIRSKKQRLLLRRGAAKRPYCSSAAAYWLFLRNRKDAVTPPVPPPPFPPGFPRRTA